MLRSLPLPAPASELVALLERAAEALGGEYFRQLPPDPHWHHPANRAFALMGWRYNWVAHLEDPRIDVDQAAMIVEACRWAALSRGLRLEMMDGLGLAGVCTPDGEQIRTSREYDPFDPVGRAKAALEVILEATDA